MAEYLKGNSKLGRGIYTYTRTPGKTCPGASELCAAKCYAKKGTFTFPSTKALMARHDSDTVPPLPLDAKVVRIHVAGDFDNIQYVRNWIFMVRTNPRVRFYAYTRSWRIAELLPVLDELRRLPNMQLFASTDASIPEPTPQGWRIAYMGAMPTVRHTPLCMEQSGKQPDCATCRYCWQGRRGDIQFNLH